MSLYRVASKQVIYLLSGRSYVSAVVRGRTRRRPLQNKSLYYFSDRNLVLGPSYSRVMVLSGSVMIKI
jgi:hypothetical protein